MPLNDSTGPAVRAPRLRILHNGEMVGGALSFEVHSNCYLQADTFSAEFALNGPNGMGIAFWGDDKWSTANPLLLSMEASVDAGQTFTRLVLGQVDHVAAHLDIGLCQVDGRDLAANFIDAALGTSNFLNHTSSEVAQALAAEHGMTADVTPTTGLVGRFDGIDHLVVSQTGSRTTTEWNLLATLAQREGYDVWVTGTTLHFHPWTAASADPFVVTFDRSGPFLSVMDLTAQRSMSFSKDITVIVQSHNSFHGRPYSAHSGRTNAPAGRVFTYTMPNLSEADCQAAANRIREQLSRHERLVSFVIPADVTLSPRDLVRVTGTGSSWDQLYRVDSITRSMSFDGGFVARIQGKSFDG